MANETVQILTIKFDAAEAIANTRKLKEERDALIAETKKLEAEEGKYSDAVLESNAQIKVLNDSIREQEKVSQNLIKANNLKTRSNQELKAQLSILTSQYNRLSESEQLTTQAGKDLSASILEINNRLKASESAVGNNFRNVGNYKSALEGIPGPIGDAVKGITGFNQTLKANPILAIVSLITLFTDVLGKIQPVADLVKQALGALSAVFDVIVNRLSLLIQGDFAGAFLGIGDAIGEAAKNGANYVKTLQDIEDTQRILDITNAESNKVVSNLLIKLKDRTKSEKERLDIADQITKEEKKAFEQQDALNKKNLAAEEKKVRDLLRQKRINADNIKDVKTLLDFADKRGIEEASLNKLSEARVKVINAETESNNLLEKAEVRRNQILDQSAEKRDKEAAKVLANLEKEEQARQKYNEKIAELTDKFISTEREKLIAGFQKDLDEIKGEGEKEIALTEAINRAKEAALTKFDNDARIKQIDRDTKVGIERIKLSQKTEEEKFLAESKITEDGLRKKLALLDQNNKEEANAVLDLNLEIQKIQQDRQKRLTEFAIADLNQQVTINNAKKQNEIDAVELSVATEEEKGKRKAAIILKYAQEELALIEKIALIDGTLTDQEIENIKRLENAVITAQNNINKAQQQNPPKTIGELFGTDEEGAKKIEKGIVFAQQSLSNLIGIINQRYQQEIQGIDEAQAAETEAIKNSELSEDEKNRKIQESNKKYALQKYDLQVKQFNADKALQLVNATIAGARAVLTGLAEFGPIGAAISGALAAAQIAIIAAQKPPAPPKFAKGVVGLEGPGNGTSDSIPAYLSKGESVITASGTRFAQAFYPGLLNFLNSKNKFADGVVNFNQASAQSPTISIASEIRAAIQDITIVTKVSDIDKASFDRQSVRTVGVI